MANVLKIRGLFCVDNIFILFVLCILQNFQDCLSDGQYIRSRREQLQSLSQYSIVVPQRIDGRIRRDANTLQKDGHMNDVSFVLPINGAEHILDLQLNRGLFAKGFIERSYKDDGEEFSKLPDAAHHCYYHGSVRGRNSSNVAISTCSGLSGLIILDDVPYYLEPLGESPDEHLLYQAKHAIRKKPLFEFDKDVYPDGHDEDIQRLQDLHRAPRVRRDVHTELKYVELVMVADNQAYIKYKTDSKALNERCKKIANIMDSLYKALNMRVALAAVEIWDKEDQIPMSTNPGTVLTQFQRWRQNTLLTRIKHDNAQFLTGTSFDGNTVGMASLATMCSRDRSAGVNEDHGNHESDVASTMSHEMGHNLGFSHDSSSRGCTCNTQGNAGCVMAASSGSEPPVTWSSCSENDLASSLERGLGACMFNYPESIFQGPTCQNSFLEAGEECDCGTPEQCDNECCVPETCTLHVNATCASGECCDKCQLKPAGTVCRNMSMVSVCDLPEYCTGQFEECPSNVYRQNGEKCVHQNTNEAMCFNGMCMTYEDQCRNLWGDKATAGHLKCYRYNTYGSGFGNCGMDDKGKFIACSERDKRCGKIMCEGGAGYPVLSALATASRGFVWDENGVKRECKTATVDQGVDIPDPGYVSDGSPCKAGSLCYNYKCLNLTEADIFQCKDNCNGNGVCNSENHCHCDYGYAPPSCIHPGPGGSNDSGPAGPPGDSSNIMIILLVLLIAAFVVAAVIIAWKREPIKKFIRSHTQPSPKRPPPVNTENGTKKVVIEHPPHIHNYNNAKYDSNNAWNASPDHQNNAHVDFKPAPQRSAPTPPGKKNGVAANKYQPEPQVSFKPGGQRPVRPPPAAPSKPQSFNRQNDQGVKVSPKPPLKPTLAMKPPPGGRQALRPTGLRNTNNSASSGDTPVLPSKPMPPRKPVVPSTKPKPLIARKPVNL